jgi:hypothetical protein
LRKPGKKALVRSLGILRLSVPSRVFQAAVAAAVAPRAAVAGKLVAAGADQAVDVRLHDDLQHALGDAA